MQPAPITTPDLAAPHGFLTRAGGVSTGAFASLNCRLGSADAPEAVTENRRRALATVAPGARLVGLSQCHSATAIVADPDAPRARADGLVTREKGVALGIVTADCAPVLLLDPVAGVAGAAHAGWRGAFGGILEATVAAMERLGAEAGRIRAVVGPHIGPESYEVDAAFRDRFLAADAGTARFFRPGRAGHHFFDLGAYAVARLANAGVAARTLADDTLADDTRFFSYRRTTLAGGTAYGCQISIIALP